MFLCSFSCSDASPFVGSSSVYSSRDLSCAQVSWICTCFVCDAQHRILANFKHWCLNNLCSIVPGRTCRGSWLNRLIVLDNHSTCILVYSTRPNKLHFSFFGWDLLFKFDNHATEVYNWSVHASPLVLDFLLRSLQVCLCKPTTRPSASLREKPEAGRLLPTSPSGTR